MSEGKSFTVWHYSRSNKKECLAGTLLQLKILGCSVLGMNASPNDVRVKDEEIGAEVNREDVFQAIMLLPKLPELMLLTGEQSWMPRPPPWLNLSKVFQRAVPKAPLNANFQKYEKALAARMETSRKRKRESDGSDESRCSAETSCQVVNVSESSLRLHDLSLRSDQSIEYHLEAGNTNASKNGQHADDSGWDSNASDSTRDRSRSGSGLIKTAVEDCVRDRDALVSDGSDDEDQTDVIMEPRGYQAHCILGQLCSENVYMKFMRLSMLDLTPSQLKELIAATPKDCPDYSPDYLEEMQKYASSMLVKTEALLKLQTTLGMRVDGLLDSTIALKESLNLNRQ